MAFLYVKALHIIFVVTWFAGLFYIVRLFIYIREAQDKPIQEQTILLPQLQLMARRLWYGITWPSAVITFGIGLYLLHYYANVLGEIPGWLWIKLGFVLGLYIYHFWCHSLFRRQQRSEVIWTSNKLRIWNEVATIFLFAIVFLVILRSSMSMLYGLLGLLAFGVMLMAAIRLYKSIREKKSAS